MNTTCQEFQMGVQSFLRFCNPTASSIPKGRRWWSLVILIAFAAVQTSPAQSGSNVSWSKIAGFWDSKYDGTFGVIAVDPNNPNVIFVASSVLEFPDTAGPGIFKSTDGGATWKAKNNGIQMLGLFTQNYPAFSKIVISKSNSDVIYLGTAVEGSRGTIYKSTDGGESWAQVNGTTFFGMPQIYGPIYALDVHPWNSDVAYAGVGGQGLMKTTDGGITWSTVYPSQAISGSVDYFNVVRIVPTHPDIVLFSGFTYYSSDSLPGLPTESGNDTTGSIGLVPFPLRKSSDGGSSWNSISVAWPPSIVGVPVPGCITDCQYEGTSGTLLLSTISYYTPAFIPIGNKGVYASTDLGDSWQSVNGESTLQPSQFPIVSLTTGESGLSGSVFATTGTSNRIFSTMDQGNTWASVNSPITGGYIGCAGLSGNHLLVLTDQGIFLADVSSLLTSASAPTLTAIPVAADQINLGWQYNGKNASSFTIFESTSSTGPWFALPPIGKDQRNYAAKNLNAATHYYFYIVATNGLQSSSWSNLAQTTTLAPAVPTHTLTVSSTNPSVGTFIYVSPADDGGLRSGVTPLAAHTYTSGTTVELIAYVNSSNIPCSSWQRDGVTVTTGNTAYVTMDADHVMTAVYGSSVSAPTLTGLSLSGAVTLAEQTSQPYTATATFSDGTTLPVAPIWSLTSGAPAIISSSGLLSAGAVVANTPITIFASYTSGGVTKSAQQNVIIAQVATQQVYTLSLSPSNYNQGSVAEYPVGGNSNSYTAGATVRVTATANSGFHFVNWTGDSSSTSGTLDVVMSKDLNLVANFAPGDSRQGTLTVTIQPPAAAAAGCTWGINSDDFRASGSSWTTYPGNYSIIPQAVPGWLPPVSMAEVSITNGQTTNYTFNFTQDNTPGIVNVTLSPPAAVAAGAHWHFYGGPAENSGVSVPATIFGSFPITFDTPPGWVGPATQNVTVTRGQTTFVTAAFTPAAGAPAISAIHPSFGALDGNTLLTIEGNNLAGVTNVTIGGHGASNITVVNSSQITCLSPASAVYGSAPVVVQTPAGAATSANGFAYGASRGSGMSLVSSVGGRDNGVAIQGNNAFVGEGSSLVVKNVSNPSSPADIARIAMPGTVEDVVLFGNYVLVADFDAGMQVVDISTPGTPRLVGYYSTPGNAFGVAANGTNAYVADGSGGLLVFDMSSPSQPALISTTTLSGTAYAVGTGTNGGKTYAYCLAGGYMYVVDTTNPANPVAMGNLYVGNSSAESLAVAGTRVFVAALSAGLQMIDASNPSAPTMLPRDGIAPNVQPWTVAAANNLVYCAGSPGLQVFSYSSGTLTFVGQTPANAFASAGYRLSVAGSEAYVAGGPGGFVAVNVSSSGSPSLSGTSATLAGDYGSVSLSGNYAYAFANHGFRVFDVTNPASPNLVGQFTGVNGGLGQVVVSNSIAYVNGSGTETDIVSVSNPASPVLKSTIASSTISDYSLAVSGTSLFVAGWDGAGTPKLMSYDVSNPASPVLRGTLALAASGSYAQPTLSVSGTHAFVGLSNGQLDVIDISNVSSLSRLGTLSGVGTPNDLGFSSDGRYVYVADGTGNSLHVVDVSNASSPSPVATVSLPTTPGRMSVSGTALYMAGASAVWQYDVSTPSAPLLVRSYKAPSAASSPYYGIAVSTSGSGSSYIYSGDIQAGLVVLQTNDTVAPTLAITAPTTTASYSTSVGTLNLSGTAADNQGVALVTWSNDQGGGGNATGTTAWSVTGVLLAVGTNHITIMAVDLAGNTTSTSLTVVYSPPDTTPPALSIVAPTDATQFTTASGAIDLQGLATDNVGVVSVQWTNDRGGGGAAAGTATWTASAIPLQMGPNIITVTASDAAGNSSSATLAVTYSPQDITPPTVTLQYPTLNSTYSTSVGLLDISGVASDDRAVAQVTWSNDQGGSGIASGTQIWSANGIVLQPGLNVVTVSAQDSAGNTQNTSLAVYYTPQPIPQIISSNSATASQGLFFSYLISGNNSPVSFDASGLPPGLTINSALGLISGVPTTTGSFNVTLFAANSGGSGQSSLILNVSALTSTQRWRLANFGTTSNAGYAADTANPSADGISNLLKYGLGLNPLISYSPAQILPVVMWNAGEPLLSDRIALGFSLPFPVPGDVTYSVEASGDLVHWTTVATKSGTGTWNWNTVDGGTTPHLIETDGTSTSSVQVGDVIPSNGNSSRYMRLSVTH